MSKLVIGKNDLYTWCQNNEYGKILLKQWIGLDEDGNEVSMKLLTPGSHKKVQWKCDRCNNIWISDIVHRTYNNSGCRYCRNDIISNRIKTLKTKQGKNDLYTWCQNNDKEIIKDWTGLDEQGNSIDIHSIARGSHVRMKWKCHVCSHIWIAEIHARTSVYHTGCPECSKSTITKNRLATITNSKHNLLIWCSNNKPYGDKIINEWEGHDINGIPLKIHDVTYGSKKKVKWRCNKCGNVWNASVVERILHRTGCTSCNHNGTSYSEQFIFNCIKQVFSKTVNRYKVANNKYTNIELDILFPVDEQKYKYKAVAIEYSPTYWHEGREYIDSIKEHMCNEYNVRLIQIIDDSFNEHEISYSENFIIEKIDKIGKQNKQNTLEKIVNYVLGTLGYSINNIDINKAINESLLS